MIYLASLSASTFLLTLNTRPFVKSSRSLSACHLIIIKHIISIVVRVDARHVLAYEEALKSFVERIPVVAATSSSLIVRSSERVELLDFSEFKLINP